MKTTLLAILSLATAISAAPAAANAKECTVVNDVVNILHLFKATAFCSSFIQIPASTSTVVQAFVSTVAVTVSPVVASTTLITSTQTVIVSETSTVSTITATSTETDTVTTTPVAVTSTSINEGDAGIVARALPTIPVYLRGLASSAISQACSCLSIPTAVITKTSTSISTFTGTQTISVTATVDAVTVTTTTTVADVEASTLVATTTTTTVAAPTPTTVEYISCDLEGCLYVSTPQLASYTANTRQCQMHCQADPTCVSIFITRNDLCVLLGSSAASAGTANGCGTVGVQAFYDRDCPLVVES